MSHGMCFICLLSLYLLASGSAKGFVQLMSVNAGVAPANVRHNDVKNSM